MPPQPASGEVLVSAGGGAVGKPLIEAALAARPLSSARHRPWRIVLGPQYPQREAAMLLANPPPGVTVEAFRPDLAAEFSGCALSISQAGYNTVLELVAAGTRAIVVPFSTGAESEQAERARRLADRGLLTVVEEKTLTAAVLAAAIDRALAGPKPVPGGGLRLAGASQTAALLIEAVARRRGSRHDGPPRRLTLRQESA